VLLPAEDPPTPSSAESPSPRPPDEPPTRAAWAAYSAAYAARYGVEPASNATVRGQLAAVVKRLGREEAPAVAAYYVQHNNRWYVEKGHAIGQLLTDAEKLRTEWATGQRITATRARQLDRTQSNGDVFAKLIAEAERG